MFENKGKFKPPKIIYSQYINIISETKQENVLLSIKNCIERKPNYMVSKFVKHLPIEIKLETNITKFKRSSNEYLIAKASFSVDDFFLRNQKK